MNFQSLKKITESNKENLTPSSFLSSASKFAIYDENNLKLLKEKKENLISQAESNDEERFKLIRRKEELINMVMEKEGILYREKAESEYLNDILREKENSKNRLIENLNETNTLLSDYICSNLCVIESQDTNLNLHIQNDFAINAKKGKEEYTFNKVYKKNLPSLNEILDKESKENYESIKLFTAYNII